MLNKNSNLKKTILCICFILFLKPFSNAEMPAAQFLLNANPNPRLYSIGNAFSAVDYRDSYLNPASLGWTVNRGFYFSHWPGQIQDSQYNFISGIFPLFDKNYFSLSYLSYTTGNETIEELDGTKHSITLEKDNLVGFGFGAAIDQKNFAGFNFKFLQSTLAEDYSASAFLLDLNIIHRTLDDRKTYEIGVFNYGSGIKYASTEEKLPTEFRLGYTYKEKFSKNLVLTGYAGYGRIIADGSNSISAGLEFLPGINLLAVRAGFIKRTGEDTIWTTGFGLKFPNIDFDFSYGLKKSDYDKSSPYRFSLNYYFGAKNQYEAAEAYLKKGMKEKALALWDDIKPYEPQYAEARAKIKTHMDPPVLNVFADLINERGGNILAGGQSGEIVVSIKNTGKSTARDVNVEISPLDNSILSEIKIGKYIPKIALIMPGETGEVRIPVEASEELSFSKADFNIKITEGQGFNPPPHSFSIETKRYPPPEPVLAKYTFREDNTGMSSGNGNGIIEKGETVEITGILANIGESTARNLSVSLENPGENIEIIKVKGIENLEIGNLAPGEYKKILFVIKIPENYKGPSKLSLALNIKEERQKYSKIQPLKLSLGKFYVDPITADEAMFSEMLSKLPDIPGPIPTGRALEVVKTYTGGAPELDFTAELSGDSNNNGVYEPGEILKLALEIRNSGRKDAKGVKVIISGDETVAKLLDSPFKVGDIEAGRTKRVELTAKIPSSIPRKTANFQIELKESQGFSPNIAISKSIGFQPEEIRIVKSYPSLKPVPVSGFTRRNSFALVIGISEYQNIKQWLKYASQDAQLVKEYIKGVIGIPEENIKIFKDKEATKSRIEAEIKRIAERRPDSIFFYFAGHGIYDLKDPKTGEPFIIPYEADLQYGNDMLIGLKDIVSKLEDSGAKEIVLILDSCFSGEGSISKEPVLLAKRGIAIEPVLDYRKSIIFSAASGRQMAGEFDETQNKPKNGYFTYYLLLGLKGEADKNKDGFITDSELCEYVKENVDKETSGNQTPECKNIKGIILGRYK